jgi:hypothetical protein
VRPIDRLAAPATSTAPPKNRTCVDQVLSIEDYSELKSTLTDLVEWRERPVAAATPKTYSLSATFVPGVSPPGTTR